MTLCAFQYCHCIIKAIATTAMVTMLIPSFCHPFSLAKNFHIKPSEASSIGMLIPMDTRPRIKESKKNDSARIITPIIPKTNSVKPARNKRIIRAPPKISLLYYCAII